MIRLLRIDVFFEEYGILVYLLKEEISVIDGYWGYL
jgi:hypothetical protein